MRCMAGIFFIKRKFGYQSAVGQSAVVTVA